MKILLYINRVDDTVGLRPEIHHLLDLLTKGGEDTETAAWWEVIEVKSLVFEGDFHFDDAFFDYVDLSQNVATLYYEATLHVQSGVQRESNTPDCGLFEFSH